MRKLSNFYNKPVVNVRSGEYFGTVKGVILEEKGKKIKGLYAISEKEGYLVTLSSVFSRGDDAITVKSDPVLNDEKSNEFIGATAISREGRRIGEVTDLIISAKSLSIEGIEAGAFISAKQIKAINDRFIIVGADEKIREEKIETERVTVFPASEKFLIGKRVARTVYLSSGEVLINSGEEIDRRTVNSATLNGKITELMYAVCRKSSKIN